MHDINYKFLIEVISGKKMYEGTNYRNVINKIGCFKIKEAQKVKQEMLEKYPNFEIIVKERFKNGWQEIKI